MQQQNYMPPQNQEKVRRFEQRMHEQGASGFADGPRPWEHWDESGHQAGNRIWEGSAKHVLQKKRSTDSLGHRLLSLLAFFALGTLLVGIGGVYFSHTQTQRIVATGVQPLPYADRTLAVTPLPERETAAVTDTGVQPLPVTEQQRPLPPPPGGDIIATTATRELNSLLAATAAPEPAQHEEATATTDNTALDDQLQTTAFAGTQQTSTGPVALAASDSIDSVAIETIVTGQSVTTTVYTNHAQQDDPEIVAAIATTPPPFAHQITSAPQHRPDDMPSIAALTDAGTSPEPATVPTIVSAAAPEHADEPVAAATVTAMTDSAPPQEPAATAPNDAPVVAATVPEQADESVAGATVTAMADSDTPPEPAARALADVPVVAVAVPEQADEAAAITTVTAMADNEPPPEPAATALADVPVVAVALPKQADEPVATVSETVIALDDLESLPAPAAAAPATTLPVEQTDQPVVDTAAESGTAATPEDKALDIAASQTDTPADDATTLAAAQPVKAILDAEPLTTRTIPDPIAAQPTDSAAVTANSGDWVINLASYTWRSTANRKLALFEQQGVDAEVFEISIKDKPMYRIRVVGFETRHAANARIPALEQQLGVKGAWISKR
jgi:hypothetical protein